MKEIFNEAKEKMKKIVEQFKVEISTIRTGRASPALVENIKVNSYGTMVPLKQIAAIAAPDTKLIVIRPWDKNLINEIEKAIQTSNIGLTPSNDGTAIRLPIPPLTEERRKSLIKVVNKIAEDTRTKIRNVRREGIEKIRKMEEVSKDEKFRGEKEMQKILDEYIKMVDEIVKTKEKEILEE